MNIDFEKASFKDFENIPGLDPYRWASLWRDYVEDGYYGDVDPSNASY